MVDAPKRATVKTVATVAVPTTPLWKTNKCLIVMPIVTTSTSLNGSCAYVMVDAMQNIIENALKASYHFEVVDILTNPQEAVKNRIIASPTLLVELPLLSRRFVGDIKDEQSLLAGLDIR